MPVARAVDRSGTPLLALRGVSTATGLRDVDLELHAGEILGLAGLMGSGRSELARAVFGIDPLTAGEIRLRGEPVRIRRPADAIEQGIVLVPEDRRTQGLVLADSVERNLTLPLVRRLSRGGLVDDAEGARIAERYVDRLDDPHAVARARPCGGCRAATSRRSCWRSGSPRSPTC